jgi:prophage DNA circulation protein
MNKNNDSDSKLRIQVSARISRHIVDGLDDIWSATGSCAKAAALLDAVLETTRATRATSVVQEVIALGADTRRKPSAPDAQAGLLMAHARLTVLARPIGESRTVEMLLDAVTIAYRRRPLEEVLEDIRDAAWEVENGGDRGVHRRPPQVEALAS